MARSSRTSFVILGLLAISGKQPRSGYEIKKVIDTVISSVWYESNGQLYPTLRRLEAAGLIDIRSDTKKGRRTKRYGITGQGRAHLRTWLAAPVELTKPRDELILKLFFGSEAEPADLIRHLEAHRMRSQAVLNRCRDWSKNAASDSGPHRPYVDLTLRAGLARSQASLRWAEESIAIVAKLSPSKP
ncbi:MAG TPA: PadR family transcriptional regulator [Opitutaceae bacterium]|jgi:DNA-binding PadR family transcriptional regulator